MFRFRLASAALVVSMLLPWAVATAQDDSPGDAYNFAAGLYDRDMHERAERAFADFLESWPRDERAHKARFYRGQSLSRLGRGKEALASFAKYLEKGGHDLRREALFRAGETAFQLGEHKRAHGYLNTLLNEGAGDLEEAGLYFDAEALGASGDSSAARNTYRQLISRFGKGEYVAFARTALGFLDFESGNYAAAREHFEKVPDNHEDKALVTEARCMTVECLLGENAAANALKRLSRLDPKAAGEFASQVRRLRVRARLAAGQTKKAIAALEEYARFHPADEQLPQTAIRGASALHQEGKSAQGLRLLALVSKAHGQDARDIAYWTGVLKSESGSLDAGIASLEKAVAQGGGEVQRFGLADALSRAGRYEEAVPIFEKLRRESKRDNLRHEAAFAEAYARNRLEQFDKAATILEGLLRDKLSAELSDDARFALGENHFAKARYEKALDAYQRVLRAANSKHAGEALYKSGWCEYRLKDYRSAARSFTTLENEFPDSPFLSETRFLLGKCHEQTGDVAKARAVFEKLGRAKGESDYGTRGLMGLAATAHRQGDLDAAAKAYRQGLRKKLDDKTRGDALFGLGEIQLEQGDLKAASKSYGELIASIPGHERGNDARLSLAWAQRKSGDHAGAVETLVALMKRDPEGDIAGEALYLGGLEYLALGEHEKAVDCLKILDREHGKHGRAAEAELLRGMAASRQKDFKSAITAFQAYLGRGEGTSGRDTAYYEMAFACEGLNRMDDRDKCFDTLVRKHPDSRYAADARFRLGESRYEAQDWKGAAAHYQPVIKNPKAGPLVAKALYKLAWCLRKTGQHDVSAKVFERLAKDKKDELAAEACYLAGDEWVAVERFDKALDRFTEVVEKHSRFELAGDAALRRVLCLSSLGRHEDVARFAGRALKAGGDAGWNLQVRSALADAYAAMKSWKRARGSYKKVIDSSEGPLAARAQYRIGVCFREAGEIDRAVDELLKVSILYGHREWGAKATLECAALLESKGQKRKALRIYEDIVTRYPERDESKVAKRRAAALATELETGK